MKSRFKIKLDELFGKTETDKEVADLLDVNPGLISKYRHKGYMAPAVKRGLIKLFPELRPPDRYRFEVRFKNDTQLQAFLMLAKAYGFDTPQDLVRWMADHPLWVLLENPLDKFK